MIIALVIAVLVLAHFTLGFLLARAGLPTAWERARVRWGRDHYARGEVQSFFWITLLFWPAGLANRAIDRTDPARLQREIANRDAEIARLERELGIGGGR